MEEVPESETRDRGGSKVLPSLSRSPEERAFLWQPGAWCAAERGLRDRAHSARHNEELDTARRPAATSRRCLTPEGQRPVEPCFSVNRPIQANWRYFGYELEVWHATRWTVLTAEGRTKPDEPGDEPDVPKSRPSLGDFTGCPMQTLKSLSF